MNRKITDNRSTDKDILLTNIRYNKISLFSQYKHTFRLEDVDLKIMSLAIISLSMLLLWAYVHTQLKNNIKLFNMKYTYATRGVVNKTMHISGTITSTTVRDITGLIKDENAFFPSNIRQAVGKDSVLYLSEITLRLQIVPIRDQTAGIVSESKLDNDSINSSNQNQPINEIPVMLVNDLKQSITIDRLWGYEFFGLPSNEEAHIRLSCFPNSSILGNVVSINSDGNNIRTIVIGVRIIEKQNYLIKTGMSGTVDLIEKSKPYVLMIPSCSINYIGTYAFVIMSNGQRQKVTVGLVGDDMTEITSGLIAGERVKIPTLDNNNF